VICSWIPRSPSECVGLTLGQFRAYAAADLDWSNKYPVIDRRTPRHRWRIVGIVDSSEANSQRLISVSVVRERAERENNGFTNWLITPETAERENI
jgi:hypothetical protein